MLLIVGKKGASKISGEHDVYLLETLARLQCWQTFLLQCDATLANPMTFVLLINL